MVAHSQGGYVSYQALTDPWHRSVELYITFGSGLIRLTRIKQAQRTPALTLALIGTVGALLAVRFAPAALLGEAEDRPKHQAEGLVHDRRPTQRPADRRAVAVLPRARADQRPSRRSVDRLPDHRGPGDEPPPRGSCPSGSSRCGPRTRGSLLADHGGYWQNSDEFVPQVAIAVATLDHGLDLPIAGPKPRPAEVQAPDDAYGGVTVGIRAAAPGSLTVAATIGVLGLLLLVRPGELEAVGEATRRRACRPPGFITDLLPSIVMSVLPIERIETALVLGAAVVVLISGSACGSDRGSGTRGAPRRLPRSSVGRDRTAEANGRLVRHRPGDGLLRGPWCTSRPGRDPRHRADRIMDGSVDTQASAT
jgi:hypothetical protein